MLTSHYDETQDDECNDGSKEDEISEDATVVPRNIVVIVAAVSPVVVIVDAVVSKVVRETRSRYYQHIFLRAEQAELWQCVTDELQFSIGKFVLVRGASLILSFRRRSVKCQVDR